MSEDLYAVVLPMLAGGIAGALLAWTALVQRRMSWLPALLAAASLGVLIGAAPQDGWVAAAAFLTGALIGFWCAASWWGADGGWGGGGGEDPEPPEPHWWPEFEAQFRDHVARARRRPRPKVGSR